MPRSSEDWYKQAQVVQREIESCIKGLRFRAVELESVNEELEAERRNLLLQRNALLALLIVLVAFVIGSA